MMLNPDQIKNLKFSEGVHATKEWAHDFLLPFFTQGIITPFPGADFYAICYGELCAYRESAQKNTMLAIWSVDVPDCSEDWNPRRSLEGEWELYLDE